MGRKPKLLTLALARARAASSLLSGGVKRLYKILDTLLKPHGAIQIESCWKVGVLCTPTVQRPVTPGDPHRGKLLESRIVDGALMRGLSSRLPQAPPDARAVPPCVREPRAHDRRGWRSRAPWRHADGVRSIWRRGECGGERRVAPCVCVAYGEGLGRSRSGPASIHDSGASQAPPLCTHPNALGVHLHTLPPALGKKC